MIASEPEVHLLNFVVVGQIRSGTSVVQGSLSTRQGVVCHGDLFHPDKEVRRNAHESYFGAVQNEGRPEWFDIERVTPWQYINHVILDNPRNCESAVGFRLLYDEVRRWELFDLFAERCREGDFCMVHVVRNPVACFVSLKQAEKTGTWQQGWDDPVQTSCPSPVYLDAGELTEFCRTHTAISGKIRASCRDERTDLLEVQYRDLFLDHEVVMRKVFEFLELPEDCNRVRCPYRRLRNRPIAERISNWKSVRDEVGSDVKKLFDSEDFF